MRIGKAMTTLAAVALAWAAVQAAEEPAQVPPVKTAPPWLGVSFTTVPKALAAHLDSGESGMMIQNVAKDSPADKAGLELYDVITAIDGKAIDQDISKLTREIAGRSAGDKLRLTIRRKAAAREVAVTLDRRPQGPVEYKYPWTAEGPVVSRTFVHPGMVLQREGNAWKMLERADLPEELKGMLKDLPRDLPKIAIASGGPVATSVSILVTTDEDGNMVQIQQTNGEITVTRTGKDEAGKSTTTTTTYKSADELREKDKDAYDLYKKSGVSVSVSGPGFGTARAGGVFIGKGGVSNMPRVEMEVRPAPAGKPGGPAVVEQKKPARPLAITEEELDAKIREAVRKAVAEALKQHPPAKGKDAK